MSLFPSPETDSQVPLRKLATTDFLVVDTPPAPGAAPEVRFFVIRKTGEGIVGLRRGDSPAGSDQAPAAGALVVSQETPIGELLAPSPASLFDIDPDPVGVVLVSPAGAPTAVVAQEVIDDFFAMQAAERSLGPGGEASDNRFPDLPDQGRLHYRLLCREPGCGWPNEITEWNRLRPLKCCNPVMEHDIRLYA
ncbi:hypothetical protein [Streptomyces sp. NPDC057301]|uniref:hypothetical protein n=1 Tax=Streptomyces sp. NPDC057301 TaxID=3346093 RepID=UPI00363AA20B